MGGIEGDVDLSMKQPLRTHEPRHSDNDGGEGVELIKSVSANMAGIHGAPNGPTGTNDQENVNCDDGKADVNHRSDILKSSSFISFETPENKLTVGLTKSGLVERVLNANNNAKIIEVILKTKQVV